MRRVARVAAVTAILGAVALPMQSADAWWGWGDGYGGFGFDVSAHGGTWGDYWTPYYGGYPFYGYGLPYGWHAYPSHATYPAYWGMPTVDTQPTETANNETVD